MPGSTEPWEKVIGLADMHGTVVRVAFQPGELGEAGGAGILIQTGAAHVGAYPTVDAMRQYAAALLDAADAVEASTP